MNNKINLSSITKLLEKLFKAGFITEKEILSIDLEDLVKIQDIQSIEIVILVELKKAIKSKKMIAFLSSNYKKEEIKNV